VAAGDLSPADRARAGHVERHGRPPSAVVRSPGRVNLIGDHTDYSEGLALPMAIDRGLWLAMRPRSDRVVRIWSELTGDEAVVDLDALRRRSGWVAYIEGVASVLTGRGADLRGFDGALTSNLPAGAGLSSSAALELAAARAFAHASGLDWDPVAMAAVGREAETGWVGVECGIMDQMICAVGEAGSAMLLDCRTLETAPTPIPRSATVVVMDTATRRELVGSAYNDRRAACRTAAETLGVPTLRDAKMDDLLEAADRLGPVVFRRARHVLNENAAVVGAAAALRAGDLKRAGTLMSASHASLAADYEVTTPALDAMAAAAQAAPGCFGARMTGAGFGGAVVALVETSELETFADEALARYESATGTCGSATPVTASAGVGLTAEPGR